MGWNPEWPYYIQGECMGNGTDAFLLFDLKDAEGVIQQRNLVKVIEDNSPNKETADDPGIALKAIPQEWLSSFGSDYYSSPPLLPSGNKNDSWNAQATGKPTPRNDPFNASSQAELEMGINSLIATITERSAGND